MTQQSTPALDALQAAHKATTKRIATLKGTMPTNINQWDVLRLIERALEAECEYHGVARRIVDGLELAVHSADSAIEDHIAERIRLAEENKKLQSELDRLRAGLAALAPIQG